VKSVYEKTSPVIQLITGWFLLLAAMLVRKLSGIELPLINLGFIVIGIAVFFLPRLFCEEGSGDDLRRKLLWVLCLAGLVIFTTEIIRLI